MAGMPLPRKLQSPPLTTALQIALLICLAVQGAVLLMTLSERHSARKLLVAIEEVAATQSLNHLPVDQHANLGFAGRKQWPAVGGGAGQAQAGADSNQQEQAAAVEDRLPDATPSGMISVKHTRTQKNVIYVPRVLVYSCHGPREKLLIETKLGSVPPHLQIIRIRIQSCAGFFLGTFRKSGPNLDYLRISKPCRSGLHAAGSSSIQCSQGKAERCAKNLSSTAPARGAPGGQL